MRNHIFPEIFPHKYYYFGSENSTDEDVLIVVDEIPENMEIAIQYLKKLNRTFEVNWNSNLIVIKDGLIVNSIPAKGSPDSIGFSLNDTYHLHEQAFDYPITQLWKRHKLLHIYKCVRTILSVCTRTHYRKDIMPLKGIHPFENKLKSLGVVDFTKIDTFNNKYQSDADSWKTIAFYLGQSFLYFSNDKYYMQKDQIANEFPFLRPFLYRETITQRDKEKLEDMKMVYLVHLDSMDFKNNHSGILRLDEEKIDMKKEKAIYE